MNSSGYLRFAVENRRFLAFGLLVSFASSPGQTIFIGVFGPELRAEFGLSHGDWSSIYMAGTLLSALVLPWSGRPIDRFDLRRFTLAVCVGLTVACLAMASTAGVVWLIAAVFLLRQFGQGLMSMTAMTSMARYFDANRGKAISIGALGLAIGEAGLPFLAVLAIGAIGWRPTYVATGVIVALAIAPAVYWLLKGHGERHRRHIEANHALVLATNGGRSWTRAEVLRDARFYLLTVGMMAPPLVLTGMFFHHLHLADVKGWSHAWITGNYIVYAVVITVTMLVAGRLVDRYGAVRLMPLHLLPMGIGMVILAVFDAPLWAPVYLFFSAVTTGVSFTASVAMWAELYGIRHIGAIKSLSSAISVFATALGPPFMGVLIDAGVAMNAICLIFALYTIVGTALIWGMLRGAPARG